jgi:uncharacterized membrane protein
MPSSAGEPDTMTAILVMAAVTLMLRFTGYWAMAYVPLTPRLRRALDALPGSVIVATVLPVAAKGGPAALLAVLAALGVMIWLRNDFLAVIAGVGVAVAVRALGFGG